MKIKMILPALTEATSPFFRPIKYSLFPPLGLATLAAYTRADDEVEIQDEHVESLTLDDEPALVVIQVYITSANRAYRLADHYRRRGAYVVLGGLHVTSLPAEAAAHADTVFIGPGEDTWPQFLDDFRAGHPKPLYRSTTRTLEYVPPIRRDLIKRHLYLVPNSIVVSRGCPHVCDFCYKEAFFEGGRSFYTQTVDAALAEIDRLPGRHLYFLDDHLFGAPRFASSLFHGMRGMGRLWQAAGTVTSVVAPNLLEKAVAAGLRSLFVGFETLDPGNLREQHKFQNLHRSYGDAIRRLHDLGVMINGSFVFGMDGDDESVFDRTVEWAVSSGIETATFHILTPYPGTALHQRMALSIPGRPLSVARGATIRSLVASGIWPMPPAGRSSSRCGISSSVPDGSGRCGRRSRRSSRSSACVRHHRRRRPPRRRTGHQHRDQRKELHGISRLRILHRRKKRQAWQDE
jgi:radical SAM superfamily enzyme YgiQ (UPF0313 family)